MEHRGLGRPDLDPTSSERGTTEATDDALGRDPKDLADDRKNAIRIAGACGDDDGIDPDPDRVARASLGSDGRPHRAAVFHFRVGQS